MRGSVQGSLKNALAPAASARAVVNVVESLNMSGKYVYCVAKPPHPPTCIYTKLIALTAETVSYAKSARRARRRPLLIDTLRLCLRASHELDRLMAVVAG